MLSSTLEGKPSEALSQNEEFSQLTDILNRKTLRLRFPDPFEADYFALQFRKIKTRSVMCARCALLLSVAYVLSDVLLLPEEISPITVAIRAGLVIPLILFLLTIRRLKFPPRFFMATYAFIYLCAGVGIIAISAIIRVNELGIPSEGVLLVMMFGYLVMAFPFYLALSFAMVLFFLYTLAEIYLGNSLWVLLYNLFFVITANVIGAVGCYFQERSDRINYLNDRLLQLARDAAEHQNERKTYLLAEASHDLRQPLHAMTLLVEALSASSQDDVHKTLVGQLQNSLLNLNQMLGSLFDMSKLEMGVISPKRVNVNVHELLSQLNQELSSKKGVVISYHYDQFEPEDSVYVHSDPVLLGRMIRNLLENAQVHAQANNIELDFNLLQSATDQERVIIRVSDDGRGIPESQQGRVFHSFYQGPEFAGQGMGLGLSIVSNLAELLDIELSLQSKLDQGTSFTLSLPTVSPELKHEEGQLRISSTSAQKHVLLVDNEESILLSATSLLQRWGYHVSTANEINQAVQLLSDQSIDLIVTDFHFDFSETAEPLIDASFVQDSQRPIMVLTADTRINSSQFKPEDLVVFYKPIAPAKLRVAMQDMVRRRALS